MERSSWQDREHQVPGPEGPQDSLSPEQGILDTRPVLHGAVSPCAPFPLNLLPPFPKTWLRPCGFCLRCYTVNLPITHSRAWKALWSPPPAPLSSSIFLVLPLRNISTPKPFSVSPQPLPSNSHLQTSQLTNCKRLIDMISPSTMLFGDSANGDEYHQGPFYTASITS